VLKVSIVIPTNERPKLFERALVSALKQDYENIEIIVRNDSKDTTLYKNIDALHDLSYKHNIYYYDAFSTGFDNAYKSLLDKVTGEYVYCLEDDDYLAKNSVISSCVKLIERHEDVSAVMMSHGRKAIDILNKINIEECQPSLQIFRNFPKESIGFQFGQVLAKTSLIKPLILEEDYLGSVNTDSYIFLLMCLAGGNICNINQIGYIITINGDNLSWDNYENCFFGAHNYINKLTKKGKGLIKDIDSWKEEMEEQHIDFILDELEKYLEDNR